MAAEGTAAAEVGYRRAVEGDRGAIFELLAYANFHHVPSPEMPEFDLAHVYVAQRGDALVGVAGYRVEGERGKTTLMVVDPSCRRLGIGERLQELRLDAMHDAGCRSVTTNADLPATIDWYKRKFGYREVGELPKLHEFGARDIGRWTTLELDLERWAGRGRSAPER